MSPLPGARSNAVTQTWNDSIARFSSQSMKSTHGRNMACVTEIHSRFSRRFPVGKQSRYTNMRNAADDDVFEVTREPIDKLGLEQRLLTGSAGAMVTLDGSVRNNTKGRRVVSLEYDAYWPMAVKEMRRVGAEIRVRWPDIERVGIIHRFGELKVSDSSVVIVVTSPHRNIAFEACRYAIDRVKQTVPIWKKEIFEDGEAWVEGQRPD